MKIKLNFYRNGGRKGKHRAEFVVKREKDALHYIFVWNKDKTELIIWHFTDTNCRDVHVITKISGDDFLDLWESLSGKKAWKPPIPPLWEEEDRDKKEKRLETYFLSFIQKHAASIATPHISQLEHEKQSADNNTSDVILGVENKGMEQVA